MNSEHEVSLPLAAARLDSTTVRNETRCGDGQMVWRRWGEGAPLVLLHGGSGSWTHWVRNIGALADGGYDVLVPDLPGFGDSASPPGGADADAAVGPLRVGLDHLLPGAFDLVGFSFGSLVATLLAAQLGERVRSLVLVGAPILPLPSGRGVPLAPWRHLSSRRERDAVHARNLQALMLHRPESVTPETVALQALNAPRDRMPGRRLVTTGLLGETLAGLGCPVRLVYGAHDALYRQGWPALMGRASALAPVRETVLLPDAGHWVQFEEAEAFDRVLLRLLRSGQ